MDWLFYLFSGLMLACAILVVSHRNPVTSALLLILVFFFMAGLFVLLEAFFLAVIQILVYAGAVMVLFLFVLMFLDIRPSPMGRRFVPAVIGGVTLGAAFLTEFWLVLRRSELAEAPQAGLDASTQAIGKTLFSHYLFPFEITSLLLLAALIGVVLLSRKEAR
jgi:NADH-quinone oxidoreductase subunit J